MTTLEELYSSSGEDFQALIEEMERETAVTPKELIYVDGTLRLYHYLPQTDDIYRMPLLIVMSLVSKPYIFDLTPGQSLIEHLVRAGFDVYLIDWGVPRSEHKDVDLANYVADWIPDCIAQVQQHSGEKDVNLLGYCLGGTLTSLYAALEPDGPVRNMLLLATPINGEGLSSQRSMLTSGGLDPDLIVDKLGNVPASMVEAGFQRLRPMQKTSGQMMLLNNLDNRAFLKAHLRITRWGADALPFAGAAFRTFANDYILGNKIVKGEFELRGRRLSLADIHIPVLHVLAEHDHVVPRESSDDLVRLISSEDKEEWVIKGGHVSLVTGAGAVTRTWPRLVEWLQTRSV